MLNSKEIENLIKEKKLIQDYIDLGTQLTPNGFDLTVAKVFVFDKAGALDFSNKERIVPQGNEIFAEKKSPKDKFGWWNLERGSYKVRTNETINLTASLVALAFSRTSLLRVGSFTQHGVWDAGFKGRGEFILVVENLKGIGLKQNARIAQLIFIRINETDKLYQGIYQTKP